MNTLMIVSDKDFSQVDCHVLVPALIYKGKAQEVFDKVSSLAERFPDATLRDLVGATRIN